MGLIKSTRATILLVGMSCRTWVFYRNISSVLGNYLEPEWEQSHFILKRPGEPRKTGLIELLFTFIQ